MFHKFMSDISTFLNSIILDSEFVCIYSPKDHEHRALYRALKHFKQLRVGYNILFRSSNHYISVKPLLILLSLRSNWPGRNIRDFHRWLELLIHTWKLEPKLFPQISISTLQVPRIYFKGRQFILWEKHMLPFSDLSVGLEYDGSGHGPLNASAGCRDRQTYWIG